MTDTNGHALHALEKLRQRALTLHGISISMSGGSSSAAGRDTADIGLKSVRVRRLNGTSARFDVYLGGGIGEEGQRGLRYKLGVEIDQLPQLIEEVIRDYYLTHSPGQTFSMFWRARLENGTEPQRELADGSATPVRQVHVEETQHVPPAFPAGRPQLQVAGP